MSDYPKTDLIILAGGQARRMNGQNKLLLDFDGEAQLSKIAHAFQGRIHQLWINSHRDHELYQNIIPDIKIFPDDVAGHLGPLMGIKTAWHYIKSDYALFIPCDITYIPPNILKKLHLKLQQHSDAHVVYIKVNQDFLYPFCLIKRSCFKIIDKNLQKNKLSLKYSFDLLNAQYIEIGNPDISYHSLNSVKELTDYQARKKFIYI
jgi:molybdenum cofactor guanylyltransferase